MGTPGHPWAFSWNLPFFVATPTLGGIKIDIWVVYPRPQTVQSWAVLWDGPLQLGQFTAKCPRIQGAAYYNFLTIIWYYYKMQSDIVSKKYYRQPPRACINCGQIHKKKVIE